MYMSMYSSMYGAYQSPDVRRGVTPRSGAVRRAGAALFLSPQPLLA